MADRFYKDIELPELANSPLPPDAGFVQLYGKDKKLAIMDSDGVETILGESNGVATVLVVDGGTAVTQFTQYVMRLDFGNQGAVI